MFADFVQYNHHNPVLVVAALQSLHCPRGIKKMLELVKKDPRAKGLAKGLSNAVTEQ